MYTITGYDHSRPTHCKSFVVLALHLFCNCRSQFVLAIRLLFELFVIVCPSDVRPMSVRCPLRKCSCRSFAENIPPYLDT